MQIFAAALFAFIHLIGYKPCATAGYKTPRSKLSETLYSNLTLLKQNMPKPSEVRTGYFPIGNNHWCGPSRLRNTFSCIQVPNGSHAVTLPIPGDLTSALVSTKKHIYIGTGKGVFAKLPLELLQSTIPHSDWPWFSLWGVHSRKATQEISQAGGQTLTTFKNGGWATRLSGEVIGKTARQDGVVATLCANQYLYGLEDDSGKILWTYRVGSDTGLRIENSSLQSNEKGFFVGTTDGSIVLIGPRSGEVIWKAQIHSESNLRFPGIVSPPLITNDGLLVSNTDGISQMINLNNRSVTWTLPYGSISTSLLIGKTIVLGTRNGAVIGVSSLGQQLWKTPLSTEAIKSLHPVGNNWAVAVTTQGQVHLIQTDTGRSLHSIQLRGVVTESHFWKNNGICLTMASGALHCIEATFL